MGDSNCQAGGLADLMGGSSEPSAEAVASALGTLCTNGCHDTMTKYFADNKAAIDTAIAAKEVGCRDLAKTRLMIVKRVCSTDDNGKYCFAEMLTIGAMMSGMEPSSGSGRRILQDAGGDAPDPEAMATVLGMMCGPCFKKAMVWGSEDERIDRDFDSESGEDDGDDMDMGFMDLLCLKAGGKWCMIEMMTMMGAESGSGDDSGFMGPEAEKFICDNPCGRPVMAMMLSMGGMGRRLQDTQSGTNNGNDNGACKKAQGAMIMHMLGAMCGKNSKGVRCGTYMAMMGSGSGGGSQQGSGTGSTRALRALQEVSSADAEAAGAAFMDMMTKCDPGDSVPTACPTGCADAIDAVDAAVGCCFNAIFSIIREGEKANKICSGQTDSGSEMSFDDQVKAIEAICQKSLKKCQGRKVSKSMKINNVKFSYLNENADAMANFKAAFVRMLSKQFAAPAEWFTVTGVREGSVVVDYDIQADTDEGTESLAQDLDSAAADNAINLSEIDAAIPDTSEARDDPLAGLETASAAPPSSATTTVLSFAAALLSVLAAAMLA